MEEPSWANTGCVMKCLIKCLFEMLPLLSTDERLLSQHLLFVIVRASSVNPINRAEREDLRPAVLSYAFPWGRHSVV